MAVLLYLALFLASGALGLVRGQTCQADAPREDCGYYGINEDQCVNDNGCCWEPTEGQPWCFKKTSAPVSYTVASVSPTELGVQVLLAVNGVTATDYGHLLISLAVDIAMETDTRLHMKIYDQYSSRWEIPEWVSPAGAVPATAPSNPLYKFTTAGVGEPFSFQLTRAIDGDVLFDTSSTEDPLQIADQFLAISTKLPGTESIYGLGERVTNLQLKKKETYTLWNYNANTPPVINLYGSHPFYMDVRQTGAAHGVYLRNSNGMDVVYDEGLLSYRVTGGVLDFYYFLGPTPEEVIQQYQEVIGRPYLPPYWSLGFHQSRYGYPSVKVLSDVVANYSSNNIPLEGMWSDIDYMDGYRDFTLDPTNYALSKMKTFIESLHNDSMKYVVVVDPAIKVDPGYAAYDRGLAGDVFIQNRHGEEFTGKVWPGISVFPDFFDPATYPYWFKEIKDFHDNLAAIDGLWLDMNEISNFCNGQCTEVSSPAKTRFGFNPLKPPYSINNQGNHLSLNSQTLDLNAQHYGSILEYNCHNLYGLMQSRGTSAAMEEIRGMRSFIVSRSTFPGSGVHGGHCAGNNRATFEDLHYSIPTMLNFQMFGIPFVGSDICGYLGDTTEELCSRWMELGAFYPFARNHNNIGTIPQEPYVWESVAEISRNVLAIRYSLLPYYYTLFYKAHSPVDTTTAPSATVMRPLFFEFPSDPDTHSIDRQFLIGSGIMISPVVDQGVTEVAVYFPKGKWYDYYDYTVTSESGGVNVTLSSPIDHIQIHLRGGAIIPQQEAAMTTSESRASDFTLTVALTDQEEAEGDLYLDDGESINPTQYSFVTFAASPGKLAGVVTLKAGDPVKVSPLNTVRILGVTGEPTTASYNGEAIAGFSYDASNQMLLLTTINGDLSADFDITWE